jgi:NAD-dependent deacetylase
MLDMAIEITKKADILVIIGTSMQVYPAASLIHYIKTNTPIYFIDPKPSISSNNYENITIFAEKASTGVEKLIEVLD